jgi:CCR4-NOT transcription complex subunit 4
MEIQTLAQLKTSDLFSQYGRIQKMFMSRRTGSTSLFTPDARYQHVNLYINFSRNNEALACIHGVDGLTLPDGHRLKATLGSTKYCASFLRGLKCTNDNCTGAHELAEEVEGGGIAAREEMSTAYDIILSFVYFPSFFPATLKTPILHTSIPQSACSERK